MTSDKVKLSKDGSSIDFVQSETLPTSLKKFRQSPEIEGFYRFIFENDLQREAFDILNRIFSLRKAKRNADRAEKLAKQQHQTSSPQKHNHHQQQKQDPQYQETNLKPLTSTATKGQKKKTQIGQKPQVIASADSKTTAHTSKQASSKQAVSKQAASKPVISKSTASIPVHSKAVTSKSTVSKASTASKTIASKSVTSKNAALKPLISSSSSSASMKNKEQHIKTDAKIAAIKTKTHAQNKKTQNSSIKHSSSFPAKTPIMTANTYKTVNKTSEKIKKPMPPKKSSKTNLKSEPKKTTPNKSVEKRSSAKGVVKKKK